MRTRKYRDVLWGIAYRLGMDPKNSLLTPDAIPFGTYISDSVRRFWPAFDWPEWTTVEPRIPVNHIVPYSNPPSTEIDKVFKVYLVDPYSTRGPIDTPFKLTDQGIHCGFEHGRAVWIKFQKPPPQFTSESWVSTTTYSIGDLVYSPTTGECYQSLVNGNLGNDPAVIGAPTNTIPQTLNQVWVPGSGGLAPQNKNVNIQLPLSSPPDSPTDFFVEIEDASGTVLGSGLYTSSFGDNLTDIIDGVRNALIASPGLSGFTFISLSSTVISIIHNSDFIVDSNTVYTTPDGIAHPWKIDQIQDYVAGYAPVPSQRQVVVVQLASSQILDNTTYTLTFTDSEGVKHSAPFTSVTSSAVDILFGLTAAIRSSIDPFMMGIWTTVDTSAPSLQIMTDGPVSVDASYAPDSSVYWQYVPFPAALFNQVVRDAYASALRDRGQTDKGAESEGVAGQLEAEKATQEYSPIVNPMTDQTKILPTYRNREQ